MRQCKGCGAGFYRGEEKCLYCGMSLVPGKEDSSERERDPWEREKEPAWDFSAARDAFVRKTEGRKRRADDFGARESAGTFRQDEPPRLKIFQRERRRDAVSAVLAISLGTFGAHWFYRGEAGRGTLYAALCWTGIPTIIGLVEGVGFLRRACIVARK